MRSPAIAVLLTLLAPSFAAAAAPLATAAESRASAPHKLDVNRATAAELVGIPGIGERLAQAILELRQRKGSFTKLEELLEVRGIGEKNFAGLVEHLTVAQQPPAPPLGGVATQSK
jgi:competence protein ComEA